MVVAIKAREAFYVTSIVGSIPPFLIREKCSYSVYGNDCIGTEAHEKP